VSNSRVYGNYQTGVFVDSTSDHAQVTGNTAYGVLDPNSGYYQFTGINVTSADSVVSGNTVYYSYSQGINFSGLRSAATGNTVYGNNNGISVSGGGALADRTIVSGNQVFNNLSHGIDSSGNGLITGNTVTGATQEGIILHNAHATIQDNSVTSNGLRGVSINEMSMAMVWKNKISDNADAGIHVTDSSMAEIDGNQISGVRPGPEGKADGIRAFYYAQVMLGRNNRIEIGQGYAVVATFGATIERR